MFMQNCTCHVSLFFIIFVFFLSCPYQSDSTIKHQVSAINLQKHFKRPLKFSNCWNTVVHFMKAFKLIDALLKPISFPDWIKRTPPPSDFLSPALSSVLVLSCLCSHCCVCADFSARGHRNKERSWWPRHKWTSVCWPELVQHKGLSVKKSHWHVTASDRAGWLAGRLAG